MKVIVGAVVMAVTEFVPHGIPVQHVHQMGVLERHQRPEHVTLVNRFQPRFQFHHGQRTVGLLQGTRNEETIGRHLYAMRRHQVLYIHRSASSRAL